MAIRDAIVKLGFAALKTGISVPKVAVIQRFYEQAYLRDFLKRLRINCFLDVGAKKGIYSKRLRMRGYKGHIFSFEPVREHFDAMSQLAKRDPSWHTFNFALGNENTKKKFNVIKAHPGLSSFLTLTDDHSTVFRQFLSPKGTRQNIRIDCVEVKRLDSILDALIYRITDPRIFLKVDTQGFDLEVVKGVERHIEKIIGLQSEISVMPIYENMPHYTQALEYYESLGFSLMNLFIVNRTRHQSILEYDCFMARLDQLDA